jgi:hypothetical protein
MKIESSYHVCYAKEYSHRFRLKLIRYHGIVVVSLFVANLTPFLVRQPS